MQNGHCSVNSENRVLEKKKKSWCLLLKKQGTISQGASQQTKLPDVVLVLAPEGRVTTVLRGAMGLKYLMPNAYECTCLDEHGPSVHLLGTSSDFMTVTHLFHSIFPGCP